MMTHKKDTYFLFYLMIFLAAVIFGGCSHKVELDQITQQDRAALNELIKHIAKR